MSAEPRRPSGSRRTLLGGERGVMSNVRVYRTADAIEFDRQEGYDVTRRSVLLDEVLLVTYHRTFGWRLLVASAVWVGFAALVSLLIAIDNRTAALATFAILGLPLLLAASLRLALRLDVVTVYGIRSKVSLAFWFRKRRAREVFTLVCRLARERQGLRRGRTVAPSPPPPALPLPLADRQPGAALPDVAS